MSKKRNNPSVRLLSLFVTALVVLGNWLYPQLLTSGVPTAPSHFIEDSSVVQGTPSEALATSVLTDEVKKQLGNRIRWNGSGAFIINENKTKLNADVASRPYATNKTKQVQGHVIPTVANALLDKSTRQYRSRDETGQGRTNFQPAGWHQVQGLSGEYNHAIDRGHLLGYAITGGLRSFDASTSNPANIAVQTAWSNQANSSQSTGQNYYETQIRRALDKNIRIRYRVTLVYAQEDDLLAVGRHLEAKAADGSLEFNVFIPNVQTGLSINYQTGEISVHQP